MNKSSGTKMKILNVFGFVLNNEFRSTAVCCTYALSHEVTILIVVPALQRAFTV